MADPMPPPLVTPYLDQLGNALSVRKKIIDFTDEIDRLMTESEIQDHQFVNGIPSLNIPEALEKRTYMRVRLFHAFFGTRPIAAINSVKGMDTRTGLKWHNVAREAEDFFDYKARHGLRIPQCMRSVITEFVDYGLGIWKVFIDYTEPTPRVLWEFVSVRDFMWPDGMGLQLDHFPWVAQVTRLTEYQMLNAVASGMFDQKVAADVIKGGTGTRDDNVLSQQWNQYFGSLLPEQPLDYPIAEMWYRDPVGADRIASVHLPSGAVLRDMPAPYKRPFFAARLDEKSSLTFMGLGVGGKLGAINEVINGVYNLTLGASIQAAQQVKLVRSGSRLAKVLFGEDRSLDLGPNFQAVTENPEADLAIKPLGLPNAAQSAVNLIGPIREYANNMFGTSAASFGNVGVSRRSPAYGVQAILEEGSMPIRDALVRLAEAFTEAAYTTFDLWEITSGIQEEIVNVLGDDGQALAQALTQRGQARKSLILDIKVVDPASTREAEAQRRLMQAQFVMQWVRELAQYITLIQNPQILPSARQALIDFTSRVEELIRRALEVSGDIQDYQNVIPDVRTSLEPVAAEAEQMAQQQQLLQMLMLAQGAQGGGGMPPQGAQQ
jgi:hypothetical protein